MDGIISGTENGPGEDLNSPNGLRRPDNYFGPRSAISLAHSSPVKLSSNASVGSKLTKLQKTKTIKTTKTIKSFRTGEYFLLTRWAMAIAQRDGRNSAIVIPEGAIIEVLGGPFDGVRLMDVKYEGELIMMFTNDMDTHTKPLKKSISIKKKTA
jgi:hypothetical protein